MYITLSGGDSMRTFTYKIKDSAGIHARPAGMLVKQAEQFDSDIEISLNGKSADAKRLFSVMGLGAAKDDEISVKITGSDEEKAETEILNFLKSSL